MTVDCESITNMHRTVQDRLLSMRNSGGVWEGCLSSSALSTATAVCTISLYLQNRDDNELAAIVQSGFRWLAKNQNDDGGWGDTVDSPSNISTTVLCWTALNLCDPSESTIQASNEHAEQWIRKCAGDLTPAHIAKAIDNVYGSDRTFSVPILTMCALAGRFGNDSQAWSCIKPLPFELAAFPHQWFRLLGLSVVSYALPALIAIGQVRHHHKPTRNPVTRVLRRMTQAVTLRKLESIQPASGGFLEATPLTSFVVMSLIAMELYDHSVVVRGLKFLTSSTRDDGSWPIDTNLATWVTTLSINAISTNQGLTNALDHHERATVCAWLLGQQYKIEHPYTHAAAGGWAWTDLSGGVPDADDTAGVLIAMKNLALADPDSSGPVAPDEYSPEPHASACAASMGDESPRGLKPAAQGSVQHARANLGMAPESASSSQSTPNNLQEKLKSSALQGVKWLIDLQNKDGGIPTFCRGWGKLPFDQSSPDLTAHALRAWVVWKNEIPDTLSTKLARATNRAVGFLLQTQKNDGSWIPLWFGNQSAPGQHNPVYGTSRVLRVNEKIVEDQTLLHQWIDARHRAIDWMVSVQNGDDGWGGDRNTPSSIEETALAVDALAHCLLEGAKDIDGRINQAVDRGYHWLVERTRGGTKFDPSPIGLYFAKLWYKEDMYPIVFTLNALGQVHEIAKRNVPGKIVQCA